MKRISQLDGVRGIAIILVLLWHYVRCQLPGGPGANFSYLCSEHNVERSRFVFCVIGILDRWHSY